MIVFFEKAPLSMEKMLKQNKTKGFIEGIVEVDSVEYNKEKSSHKSDFELFLSEKLTSTGMLNNIEFSKVGNETETVTLYIKGTIEEMISTWESDDYPEYEEFKETI